MICDTCKKEVYRATISSGKTICGPCCGPIGGRNVLFSSIVDDLGAPQVSKIRGFKKAKWDMIGNRRVDYQGNIYENGRIVEQQPHQVALAMDKRIRENKYGMKHGQPDQSPGWHRWDPSNDAPIRKL